MEFAAQQTKSAGRGLAAVFLTCEGRFCLYSSDFNRRFYLIRDPKVEGKGSHSNWKHPKLQRIIAVEFKDGEDVPQYLEKQLKQARKPLESLEQGENQEE